MTLFYLIRHAEIVVGPGDPGLNAAGQAQAAAVGAYLKNRFIATVYSSPLRRARETADIIAQTVGEPVVVDPRLRERMNWGDIPGQSWADFETEWERASVDRDYVPAGGLSARQAAANLADFLGEMAQHFPVDTLAAVAHSGILGDYLAENFSPRELDRLNMDWQTRQGEVITHCSITTLRWEAQCLYLESLAVVVTP